MMIRGNFRKNFSLLCVISMVLLVPGWLVGENSPGYSTPGDSTADTLHGLLKNQQDAWNQGEIVRFMEAYWKDPMLTFSSGGKTTRGWQATLDRYRAKYPDAKAMGKLTFDALETNRLDSDSALTLGNWKLEKENPAQGNFTLVWQRIQGHWKIVHDHSSLLPESN
ncbi:MAG: YybH family protein [Pirellula sp.]